MKIKFEDCELNTETSQLFRAGIEVSLEPRALDMLILLIEHRDRVVSKDEIIAEVWGGRFTSDAAVSTCLKTLRKALQDTGDEQRFVRTQRGRGFRFIAEVIVEEVERAESGISVTAHRAQDEELPLTKGVNSDISGLVGKPSLVVLPFHSLFKPENDSVLAEAISHELIQSLARLRWLRVIARGTAFQFRMPHPDLGQIGQQLSVRYALCGSLEVIPNGWAINVELSNCETSDIIWAERYEAGSDSLHDIRQQIVTQVIASLEMYIPLHEANQAMQQNAESLDAWSNYHLGLRHMFRFNKLDNSKAKSCFQRAIDLEPTFARAWAGLSFTRFQDAFVSYDSHPESCILDARRFAEQSVDLDPLDPFTNYNMGRSFWLDGDVIGSQSWLERSVTLSPNFSQGHYSCAFSEIMQGNPDQAMVNSELALNTSPLDPMLYAIYGVRSFSHLMNENLAQAVEYAEKSARTPGAHFLIPMIAAAVYALAGDQIKANYWYHRALKLNATASASHFFAAFPFYDEGFRKKLQEGLKRAGFP